MRWLNYIKVSLRTLFLHRSFSLLTLVGLAVGIAMSMLVLQFVFYQTSFDNFYRNPDDIFRVVTHGHLSDEPLGAALVPMVLGPTLDKYPEVEVLTRVVPLSEKLVKSEFAESYESNIVFADSVFFQVFDRPFLLGDSPSSLTDTKGAAISASAAKRFFGSKNPVGRSFELDDTTAFTVKAVFKDVPANSHFKYDIVLPFENLLDRMKVSYGDDFPKSMKSWFVLSGYAYFRRAPGVGMDSLENNINAEADQLMNPELLEAFGEMNRTDLNFVFQQIRHIYLFSDLDFEIGQVTNPVYVFIFLAVAIFILAVTAVNFINLTIARAIPRFKEVGVRRVFGARRSQIITQFFVESVFFSFLSLFFGLVLVELFGPYFYGLVHLDLATSVYREQLNILWVLGITFFVGLLSGSYPALFFSGFPSYNIFKGKIGLNKRGIKLRGFLVFLQVVVAVMVLTIALGMHRQLRLIDRADLGFNRDNLFMIERTGLLKEKTDSVIGALMRVDGVESVVKLYKKPGENISLISFYHGGDTSRVFLFGVHYVDCRLFDALDVKLLQGDPFDLHDCSDSTRVLINATGARMLNLDSVNGEYLESVSRSRDRTRLNVVGVLEDVYFENLKQELRPTIYLPATSEKVPENLLIRYKGGDFEGVKGRVLSEWNHLIPGTPFHVAPFSEHIASFYDEDRRYSGIADAFALLALFIASLGLIGMVSFILGYRKNQMQIRKLAGASTDSILWNTFKGYFFSVVLGVVLSVPLSIMLLKIWLRTFSFNFGLNLFCFLGPAILVVVMALVIAAIGGSLLLRRASMGIGQVSL